MKFFIYLIVVISGKKGYEISKSLSFSISKGFSSKCQQNNELSILSKLFALNETSAIKYSLLLTQYVQLIFLTTTCVLTYNTRKERYNIEMKTSHFRHSFNHSVLLQ